MSDTAQQKKQSEWLEQWTLLQDNEKFLFEEWIYPNRLEDFVGKSVLDCGCGEGQHIDFIAPYAKKVVGVDLNTAELARRRNSHHGNVEILEGDIATFKYPEWFDIVYCVGVVHHTDNPDWTFQNLARLCKPGGRLIIWCYSVEGNQLVRWIVEPLRKLIFSKLSRPVVLVLSKWITALLYPFTYTVYRTPFLHWLPYYEYFGNFHRLSFERNVLNVFDKLNAPQTEFISRRRIEAWFKSGDFSDVYIDRYKGVSWRATGIVRDKGQLRKAT